MSAKILRSPTRRANTIDFIFVGNYARSSQLFESGFTGFRGLTITSLVSVEGYYEIVLSFQDFSPMRYASAKKRVKNNSLQMNLMLKPKTSSVILEILKILIQDKMPSTSFNGSRRGELNSAFFDHYLFFYSNYHAHKIDHPSI